MRDLSAFQRVTLYPPLLLSFMYWICGGENSSWDGTCWLISTVPQQMYSWVHADFLPSYLKHHAIFSFTFFLSVSCFFLNIYIHLVSMVDKIHCDTYLIELTFLSLSQALIIITISVWSWPLAHNMSGLSVNMKLAFFFFFLTFWCYRVSQDSGFDSPFNVNSFRNKYNKNIPPKLLIDCCLQFCLLPFRTDYLRSQGVRSIWNWHDHHSSF